MSANSGTALAHRCNAGQLLLDKFETYAERTALLAADERCSYRELATLSNQAGNALRASGVGASDRILIPLEDSVALVALMAIGALTRHYFNLRLRGLNVWPILLVAARGQHQDRLPRFGADAAQHFEAFEVGQHHVEHDVRVLAAERARDALPSGVHGLDDVAFGGEVFSEQLAQLRVVVDDQTAPVGAAGRGTHLSMIVSSGGENANDKNC